MFVYSEWEDRRGNRRKKNEGVWRECCIRQCRVAGSQCKGLICAWAGSVSQKFSTACTHFFIWSRDLHFTYRTVSKQYINICTLKPCTINTSFLSFLRCKSYIAEKKKKIFSKLSVVTRPAEVRLKMYFKKSDSEVCVSALFHLFPPVFLYVSDGTEVCCSLIEKFDIFESALFKKRNIQNWAYLTLLNFFRYLQN